MGAAGPVAKGSSLCLSQSRSWIPAEEPGCVCGHLQHGALQPLPALCLPLPPATPWVSDTQIQPLCSLSGHPQQHPKPSHRMQLRAAFQLGTLEPHSVLLAPYPASIIPIVTFPFWHAGPMPLQSTASPWQSPGGAWLSPHLLSLRTSLASAVTLTRAALSCTTQPRGGVTSLWCHHSLLSPFCMASGAWPQSSTASCDAGVWLCWQQPPDTTVYGQEKLSIPPQQLWESRDTYPPHGALVWGHSRLSLTPSLAAMGPLASMILQSPDCCCLHSGCGLPQPGVSPSLWTSQEPLGREGSSLVMTSS